MHGNFGSGRTTIHVSPANVAILTLNRQSLIDNMERISALHSINALCPKKDPQEQPAWHAPGDSTRQGQQKAAACPRRVTGTRRVPSRANFAFMKRMAVPHSRR